MQVVIDLQEAPEDLQMTAEVMARYAEAALTRGGYTAERAELTLRFCSAAEMQHLNHAYRGIDRSTNILSFPFAEPRLTDPPLLGDVLLCHAVIAEEAACQHKSLEAHLCHLIVHGCLHLLHYDHHEPQEAAHMENLEIEILADLGFPNPYARMTADEPPDDGGQTGPA